MCVLYLYIIFCLISFSFSRQASSSILDENIPLLTDTYQTNPTRNGMIELLNNTSVFVGTPEIIVDYLPFIKNNFKWIICDEIHMIGKIEGSSMEYIIKLLSDEVHVYIL